MSLQRFAALVGTYGARVARWPQGKRLLFARYAATGKGRQLLDQEARIDAILDDYSVAATVSSGLMDRIYAIATGTHRPSLQWERRFLRISALSCAICLVAGLAFGLRYGNRVFAASPPGDAVSALVFGPGTWTGEGRDAFLSR